MPAASSAIFVVAIFDYFAANSFDRKDNEAGSRSGAFRATALTARSAEQAAAIPAPHHRLERPSHHLRHKEQFDHNSSFPSQP
jgi:hypothetical protein